MTGPTEIGKHAMMEPTEAVLAWQLEEVPEVYDVASPVEEDSGPQTRSWSEVFATIAKWGLPAGVVALAGLFYLNQELHIVPGLHSAPHSSQEASDGGAGDEQHHRPAPGTPVRAEVTPQSIEMFRAMVSAQGIQTTDTDEQIGREAQVECQDAVNGDLQRDIDGTVQKGAKPAAAQMVVQDALSVFCPQYG